MQSGDLARHAETTPNGRHAWRRQRRTWGALAIGLLAIATTACGSQEGQEPAVVVDALGDVTGFDAGEDGLVWLDGDVFQASLAGGQGEWLGAANEGCAVQQADSVVYVVERERVHFFADGLNQVIWTAAAAPAPRATCQSLVLDAGRMQFAASYTEGGSLWWGAIGSTESPSSVELPGLIRDTTFDEEAAYFSTWDNLFRYTSEDDEFLHLASVSHEPHHLVQQGTELFWMTKNGTELTFWAISKTGTKPRKVAVESRGCGRFTNLVAHGQHLYYGGNQSLTGEDCSDGNHSISRVPMAGGDPEVVAARSSMHTPRWLRIHDDAVYFVDCDPADACAIKSLPLPD